MKHPHDKRIILLLVAALTLPACSEDESTKKTNRHLGDGSFSTDKGLYLDGGAVDLGAVPDGLEKNSEGPQITYINPKADSIVVGAMLKVEALIQDPDEVDAQSVYVTIQGQQPVKMTKTETPDQYEGLLEIGDFKDKMRIWVEAADLKGNKNTEIVEFSRDPGPIVRFDAPEDQSRHKSSVSVQITVGDRYGIASFSARIGNQTLQLTNKSTEKDLQVWVGTIKFADFTPALGGKQIFTAEAENVNKAKTVATRVFFVDNVGPEIAIKGLIPGQLVGGIVKLEAQVSDPAGVLASSVQCVIGNDYDTRIIPLSSAGGTSNTYTGQFDTKNLTKEMLWPVISVRAADALGNESHYDIQVGLDNGPPIVELDPPRDFHISKKKESWVYCSQPFDPVGYYAANDLEQVPQLQELRVRIEDQGNDIYSAKWVPVSTVNPATTWIYVLDDTSKPLVLDTDGDGYCDDINPDVIPIGTKPAKGEAVAVNIAPISPVGEANFTPPYTTQTFHSFIPKGCGSWGTEDEAPEALCKTVAATVAIFDDVGDPIYSIPPFQGLQCLGLPFDFKANSFDDGWACVAAVADDKLGNRGVSPPLRLYVKKDWQSIKGMLVDKALQASARSCTGTLDKSGKITNTPCTFRDPRDVTLPENKNCIHNYCDDCQNYNFPAVDYPQRFYHCQVRLK